MQQRHAVIVLHATTPFATIGSQHVAY
jgi:hypothetical protein